MSNPTVDNKYKVLVVGGTGRTGQEVIKASLRAGYDVRAVTRDLKKAKKFEQGDVEWQQCDATTKECMLKAAEGRDAILSTIGPDNTSKTTIYSDFLRNAIEVMKEKNVKRLLYQTCHFNYPHHSWFFRNIGRPALKNIEADMILSEKMLELRQKDIEWTVIRAFHLIPSAPTGQYRLGYDDIDPKFKTKTHTGDFAEFMVKEAFEKKYLHDFITIGM